MVNATDIAYNTIRGHILDGTFAPNERLKEEELVDLCGVSRTPVREALHRLAADDFVVVQRNQGAQVKSWSADDLDDLFSLRALLEGYAAHRAASRFSEDDTASIRGSIQEMDDVLVSTAPQSTKITEFLRLNWAFHERIWRAADSPRLVSLLSRLVEQALMAHTAQRYSLSRVAQSHHHHKELLEALEARDAVWAESIMKSHIRAGRHTVEPLGKES